VGDDGLGRAVIHRLRGEGVDTRALRADPSATTGVMFRERRALGPAQVVYARSGSAGSHLEPADLDRAAADGVFDGARWLHVTGITPALSSTARAAIDRAVSIAREGGLTISLDVNLRRRLWSDDTAASVLRPLAGGVDVVLGSLDEVALIAGCAPTEAPAVILETIIAMGPRVAIAKLGAAGAIGRDGAGQPVSSPALVVPTVLDPVGAGDAFCAGYIAATLEGSDLADALRTANACGAAAVAAVGDLTGLPTDRELERLLDEGGTAGGDTIR